MLVWTILSILIFSLNPEINTLLQQYVTIFFVPNLSISCEPKQTSAPWTCEGQGPWTETQECSNLFHKYCFCNLHWSYDIDNTLEEEYWGSDPEMNQIWDLKLRSNPLRHFENWDWVKSSYSFSSLSSYENIFIMCFKIELKGRQASPAVVIKSLAEPAVVADGCPKVAMLIHRWNWKIKCWAPPTTVEGFRRKQEALLAAGAKAESTSTSKSKAGGVWISSQGTHFCESTS